MSYQITADCNGCGACVQWCPTKAIQGRRKQKHTILESKCIECGACGRICPSRAVVDAKGELQARAILALWPKPVWDYSRCNGCEICITACPVDCLKIVEKSSETNPLGIGKPYLASPRLCISCGFCVRECSEGAVKLLANCV